MDDTSRGVGGTPESSSGQFDQPNQYEATQRLPQDQQTPQSGQWGTAGPQFESQSQYPNQTSQPWSDPAGSNSAQGTGLPPQTPGGPGAPTPTPERGKGGRAGTVVLAAVLAAVIGGLSGWAVSSQTGGAVTTSSTSALPSSVVTKVIQGNSSSPDWTATAKAVSDSVVSITVQSGQGGGAGSGVILNANGDIVTNNHVVAAEGGGSISVGIGDKTYPAAVVGTDPSTDLAVIRLKQVPENLRSIDFGNSDTLDVGAPVMAIGNPLGLSGSVTTGIISALNRPVTTSASEQGQASGSDSAGVVVTSAIQTSAPINPGNSGGALVNASGQLIGINSSIASLSSGSSNSQSGSIGIGFAIPANQVRNITDQLIATGKAQHAFLGVSTTDGTATVDGVTTSGAAVRAVEPGSPAAKAGIHRGDVVVAMNSTNVTSGESLVGLVRSRKVGEQVALTIVRNGSQQKVTVTLAAAAQ